MNLNLNSLIKKNNFILKDQISIFLVFLLSLSSFYLGYVYSYFNTDIYHYSHILEPYLDFKNNYKLNKEIFVLYGNGQIHLFNLIDYFFDVNIVKMGVITQFFFSLKFILFFLIIRFFLNNYFSIIATIFYYFLYTFTQTASPDIYASFFLHLFFVLYLYNSKSQSSYLILICSLILFLIIFFRNTYLINFLIFLPLLLLLNIYFKKILRYEIKIFFYFFLILTTYLFSIYLNKNIFHWFHQSLGVGFANFLDIVPSNNEEVIDKIRKLIYYILRIFRHIIYPNSYGSSVTFSIIILTNISLILLFCHQIFIKKNQILFQKYKLLVIICLISFCGSIQVINKFETARYINASFGFILIFFCLINYFFYNFFDLKIKISSILITILIFIPAILKFPFYSNLFSLKLNHYRPLTVFNFKNNYYQNYDNIYFKNKKFGKDYIEYYDTIKSVICDYDTIHNLSFDRSFHYLCENKKNYIPGLYYKTFLTKEINLEYLKKNNVGKSILISDNIITDLEIVKKIKLPTYFRYSKTDHGYVYFTDTIYIYKL